MGSHTPASIAKDLGVSTQTIRRWSDTFGELLSDGATARPRVFNDTDLLILKTAQSWLAAGLTMEDARERLGDFTPADLAPVEDGGRAGAISPAAGDALGALVGTLERIDRSLATMADQSGELGELRRRVAALEDAGRDPGQGEGLGGRWSAWILVLIGVMAGILGMIVLWIILI